MGLIRGEFASALRRDFGGMPAWALGACLISVLCLTAALTAGLANSRDAPAYAAPTDAPQATLPAPMPFAVFIGDSYTQGVGGDGTTWPAIVGAAQGWDVANLGLGGTGYIRTSGRDGCGRSHCGAYREVTSEILGTPRFVIVSGGRNDLGLPEDDIARAADELFADLSARYPDAQILAINPWFDDDPPPSSPSALIEAIRTAATAHGALFVDAGQPLLHKQNLVSDDGIHPNASGYRALAESVLEALPPTFDR